MRNVCPTTLLFLFVSLTAQADEPLKPSSEKWEAAMQKFEAADKKQMPPKGEILFVGSSSIRLWDLDTSFPNLTTINRGFGGSQIVDSIVYADRIVFPYQPRIVVMYAGDNDINAGKSAEVVHRDFRMFVKRLHDKLPDTKLLYIAIKPSIARRKLAPEMKKANDLIAADCAKDDRLTFIDIWTPMLGEDGEPMADLMIKDGLHLNAKGYAIWAKILKPHLTATPLQAVP